MNNSGKKIAKKLTAVNFIFVVSLVLGGCSTIYDGIMWAPRKVWGATGDKWFMFHNPQDTDMGPRRKPVANPQGGGSAANSAYPFSQRGAMGIAPSFPQSGAMPQPNNNYPAAASDSSPYPAQVTVSNPQSAAQDSTAKGSNYPALGNYDNGLAQPQLLGQGGAVPGAIPIPAMPPEYQQSYTTGNTGKMAPPQKMPGDFIAPPELGSAIGDEGISPEAAYAQGGGASKSQGWSLPFLSGKYKVEARFEPLAEEFVVQNVVGQPAQGDETAAPDARVIPSAPLNKNSARTQDDYGATEKERAKRNSSMFPLDKYAPKATVEVSTMGTMVNGAEKVDNSYPKLGRIPANPDMADTKSSAAELNAISKEAEEMQARKATMTGQPTFKVDSAKYPDMKVKDAPAQIDNKSAKPQSSMWDKVPLVRRRDAPASSISTKSSGSDAGAVAPGALQGDAAIMQGLGPDGKLASRDAGKPIPEKGFFSRLHDKLFPTKPKQVWRKSEPPRVAGENVDSNTN